MDLLKKAEKEIPYLLDYDSDFSFIFTKNKSIFCLFNFLTEKASVYFLFPFIKFPKIIPEKPKFSYPDIDDLSFSISFSESKDKVFLSLLCRSDLKLNELYEEAIDHANYMGLNEECLGVIDEIPLKDAKFHKKALQSILAEFEEKFTERSGQKPTKEVKEPLSVLYHLHKDLKKRCKRTRFDELMKEKTELQIELNKYRKHFKERYGRDLQTKEDKEPIKAQYQRYKEIKEEIKKYEKT